MSTHINSVIFILLGREVLDEAAAAIGVGVTTDEIDRVIHEACMERDCYPSPLNYYNFPKSVCTSVNGECCCMFVCFVCFLHQSLTFFFSLGYLGVFLGRFLTTAWIWRLIDIVIAIILLIISLSMLKDGGWIKV